MATRATVTDRHVIICGDGRSSQHVARFLDQEKASFNKVQPGLLSLVLPPGSAAVGKTLKELGLTRLNVKVNAIRLQQYLQFDSGSAD